MSSTCQIGSSEQPKQNQDKKIDDNNNTDKEFSLNGSHDGKNSKPNVTSTQPKAFGITSPISVSRPTPYEVAHTKELIKQLKDFDIFETQEEMSRKLVVLDKLNKLAKTWIVEYLIKKRMPESDAKSVGGHIRTFGSYRLGVHTKGGDIDAVMIVPRHVDRSAFFDSFASFLRGRCDVKNLRGITEAYVPVMKFNFSNIEIDLLFCQLSKYQVEEDVDLKSPGILKDMEIKDIRSINGFRIADEILALVPNQNNFRITLHVIKLWAKRRELYSNILGFIGGITWALLVARVCQLYPYAAPSTLVEKFFLVYNNWDWDHHPILLKKIVYGPMGMTLPQWHMQGVEQNRLMSIVTATYPEQNTTHNVTLSTRTIILNQFQKALQTATRIYNKECSWKELFTPFRFFEEYMHFLVLTADSGSSLKFLEWNGFVESKLRLLVMTLEKNIYIRIAHPHCHNYPALPSERAPYIRRWFIGLDIRKSEDHTALKVDLAQEIAWFENELLRKSNSILYYPNKTVTFNYVRRKDLCKYLSEEVIGPKRSSRKCKAEGESSVVPPVVTAGTEHPQAASSPGDGGDDGGGDVYDDESGVGGGGGVSACDVSSCGVKRSHSPDSVALDLGDCVKKEKCSELSADGGESSIVVFDSSPSLAVGHLATAAGLTLSQPQDALALINSLPVHQ